MTDRSVTARFRRGPLDGHELTVDEAPGYVWHHAPDDSTPYHLYRRVQTVHMKQLCWDRPEVIHIYHHADQRRQIPVSWPPDALQLGPLVDVACDG